jgi:hypothetical protein
MQPSNTNKTSTLLSSSTSGTTDDQTTLIEPPIWRLEVEVGRSGYGTIPTPEPRYMVRLETTNGPKILECDYQMMGKLKTELETSLENLRDSTTRLRVKKS